MSASLPGPREHAEISAFEWVVATAGLLLVVGMLAFLLLDARGAGPRAPDLVVRVDSIATRGARHLVHFTVRNDGRATAAAVGISGTVVRGDSVETSAATLDYVPGRSERSGGLQFSADPRHATLRVRAEGYRVP